MTALSPIDLQVTWNRLVSVVEEQAQTLIRIAFSTAVRKAGDLSAGTFDTDGKMIAQAVTGTPGHVNSMAISVGHFLVRHPVEHAAGRRVPSPDVDRLESAHRRVVVGAHIPEVGRC
jgi:N-methylhydantoinase B/oxoprolinase/acetone carboxylase alpha subunit